MTPWEQHDFMVPRVDTLGGTLGSRSPDDCPSLCLIFLLLSSALLNCHDNITISLGITANFIGQSILHFLSHITKSHWFAPRCIYSAEDNIYRYKDFFYRETWMNNIWNPKLKNVPFCVYLLSSSYWSGFEVSIGYCLVGGLKLDMISFQFQTSISVIEMSFATLDNLSCDLFLVLERNENTKRS